MKDQLVADLQEALLQPYPEVAEAILTTMYSQNDEERFILEFFSGRVGRFLDIGAFDGVRMSNTRKLMELGWSGVLVEPMWTNFKALVENCRPFGSRASLVLAAVTDSRGLERLWVDNHPDREWSTTISSDLLEIGSIMQPDAMNTVVASITMDELWPLGPFDFVSIDAEWEDFSILKTTRQEQWKDVKLLCVEPRGVPQRHDMKEWLRTIGFETAYETPENLLSKNVR